MRTLIALLSIILITGCGSASSTLYFKNIAGKNIVPANIAVLPYMEPVPYSIDEFRGYSHEAITKEAALYHVAIIPYSSTINMANIYYMKKVFNNDVYKEICNQLGSDILIIPNASFTSGSNFLISNYYGIFSLSFYSRELNEIYLVVEGQSKNFIVHGLLTSAGLSFMTFTKSNDAVGVGIASSGFVGDVILGFLSPSGRWEQNYRDFVKSAMKQYFDIYKIEKVINNSKYRASSN